jgi:uncharacterized oxidoreductase
MNPVAPFHNANVLITGGSTGIGLGLAQRFLAAGARVLVTGRDRARLQKAAAENPGLETLANDIADAAAREQLAQYVREGMPGLNVLVNNAGIQRRISIAADRAPWPERQVEIDTLLAAPIHLSHLLAPVILSQSAPGWIINVTSGGAYLPQPFAPTYSACKAALHSYTVNLRYALRHTHCRVVELIPPAVRTALAGPGATHGAPLDEFCDTVFAALEQPDVDEVGFGVTASERFNAPKQLYRQMFDEFSGRFPVEVYE